MPESNPAGSELGYARQLVTLIREIRAQPGGHFSGDGEVWVGPYIVHFGYDDEDPVKIYTCGPDADDIGRTIYTEVTPA